MAKKSEVSGQKSEVRLRRTNGGAFVREIVTHAGGTEFLFGDEASALRLPKEVAAAHARRAPNLEIVEG